MSPPTNEPWFPSSQSESDSQFWTLFTTQKWLLSNFMMCMWLYRFIYLFFLGKNFSSIWLKSERIGTKGFVSYLNYLIFRDNAYPILVRFVVEKRKLWICLGFKVNIFCEGHKILRNLHKLFVLCTASQIIFRKICGLLRIHEL